jgi:RNase P/RNase MRP subunit POP5
MLNLCRNAREWIFKKKTDKPWNGILQCQRVNILKKPDKPLNGILQCQRVNIFKKKTDKPWNGILQCQRVIILKNRQTLKWHSSMTESEYFKKKQTNLEIAFFIAREWIF